MRTALLLIILLSFSTISFAQLEASQWLFGFGAGLDFRNNPPTLYDTTSTTETWGTASIADRNGNLLFYSDGELIWDRRHKLMPNGSDINGFRFNASQPVIIIPLPNNEHLYYVFTTGFEYYGKGFDYSIVDMRVNNGYGDVTQKNIHLRDSVQYRVTATNHMNKKDFWVLVHHLLKDEFYAYLFTENGVNPNPVISKVGSTYPLWRTNFGQMKYSPTGSKIAITFKEFMEIFEFDNETGRVFNTQKITDFPHEYDNIFGVEFSPNENYLYGSSSIGRMGGHTCCDEYGNVNKEERIIQFDISNFSVDAISQSAIPLKNEECFGFLQLGPDGRIYAGTRRNALDYKEESEYIAIISKPNERGEDCEIIYDGIRFPNKVVYEGLPNFVQSYFNFCDFVVDLPSDTTICEGQLIEIELPDNKELEINWKDGSNDNFYTIEKSGIYKVEVSNDYCTKSDSFNVEVVPKPDINIEEDTLYVFNDQTIDITIDSIGSEVYWQDGSTGFNHTIQCEGIYWVKSENVCFSVADSVVVVPREIYIPNVVTPNDDGYNDYFKINGIEHDIGWQLLVYNRYGKLVFKDDNYVNDWNPINLSANTYYYYLSNQKFNKLYKGWISILK